MSLWNKPIPDQLRRIPLVNALQHYGKRDLRKDTLAGLTVGVIVVPQGLAYAMLAGLPPVFGLYASLIPTILYGIFGSSRQMSVGPVAMSSLLVLAGLGAIAEPGTGRFIGLAIATALFVGVIQIGFGVFKLGFLVNFLSMPVIKGFTAAAAVIIAGNQLTHMLGINLPRSNHVDVLLSSAFRQLHLIHWPTLLMGLGSIGLIVGLRAIHKSIPGALIAVILGIGLVSGLHLADQGVSIVGYVPQGLPDFRIPRFTFFDARDLISLVFLLTFISMIESIAIAKAIEGPVKYRLNPDHELIALGVSKVAGAFFQAYPTTGSFARSAVNAESGAKTGLSSILAAVLVALTLLFFTPLFANLPKVVLAATIITAVAGLIDFRAAKRLWFIHRSDFYMMIATFMATVYLGILQGVLAGVILSLVLMVYRSTKPHVTIMGRIPGTNHFRNVTRFPQAEEPDDALIMRFDAPLFFGNTAYFLETIEQFVEERGSGLQYFILDASSIHDIDSSGADALAEIIRTLQKKKIVFLLAAAIGPLRDRLYRAGLMQMIGAENQFLDVNDAVLATEGKTRKTNHAVQTNIGEI
jgi:SulP family sulfate permease